MSQAQFHAAVTGDINTIPEKEIQQSTADASPKSYPTTSPSASSAELDDSYDLYKKADEIEHDADLYKKVLRKIDWRIMPVLFVTYALQYLDKNSINFATAYGFQKGTGLVGQDYSWLGMDVFSSRIHLRADSHRLYLLLRISHCAISSRVCAAAPPNWKILELRDHRLGHHPHYDARMSQLCGHSSESLYARSG